MAVYLGLEIIKEGGSRHRHHWYPNFQSLLHICKKKLKTKRARCFIISTVARTIDAVRWLLYSRSSLARFYVTDATLSRPGQNVRKYMYSKHAPDALLQ